MLIYPKKAVAVIIYVLALGFIFQLPFLQAQTATELQTKIEQRNLEIKNLEKEIAEFQKQINTLSGQASSLSSTIKSLELTQKKLSKDITLTEKKISNKNFEIQNFSKDIINKESKINEDRHIIQKSLILMSEFDSKSIPELLLASASLSNIWDSAEQLSIVQKDLISRIRELEQIKVDLETDKRDTEKARAELLVLNQQLKDQRKITENTASEKNKILKETKQSEAQFQKILVQKKSLKDAFEKEVLAYESQLRLTIDASKIPQTGSGILSWPLDNVFITQYFGNTEFATANSQIYNGKGHTGIDLRASIGTPIKASSGGTVIGVGNTDAVASCLSYGKWIMIAHPNGLSTLYAHLSLQTAKKGDTVLAGQIIGYSGNTGYSTGPHLHFGVYASDGVQIKSFDSSINCKGVPIPLADFRAYLNPLSFL